MMKISNELLLRRKAMRKQSENIENILVRPTHGQHSLSSPPYLKGSSSLRVRSQLSSRECAGSLQEPQLRLLYKAKCLDLGIPVLPDQQRRFFISCQSYFKNRRFVFKDMNLGVSSAKAIGKVLSQAPGFCFVNLSKNIFGDTGTISLCKRLHSSLHIVHLDISSNNISAEGASRVLNILASQKSLISLDLSSHEGLHRNRFNPQTCKVLADFLTKNKMLTTLNIANTSIGNPGLLELINGIQDNRTLLSLDLSNNGFSEHIQEFCAAVGTSNIQKLEFAHNRLGNEGAEHFANLFAGTLGDQCPLQMVDIGDNHISIKGLVKLMGALRLNIYLESVCLDGNCFENGLSSEFVSFMQGNKILRSLSMNKCSINDEGAEALYEGLVVNTALESLHLTHNAIGNAGARSISLGLSKNTALKSLNLANNKIKTQGGVCIANSLRLNRTLETINLRCNKFNNSIAEQFIEVTRANLNILAIKLDENLIDVKFLHDINQNLNRNRRHKINTVVPLLKSNIKKLATLQQTHVKSHLRMKAKEKKELKSKLNRQVVRFEDVKSKEEAKTQQLVEERQAIKEKSMLASKSLANLEESLVVKAAQYARTVNELTDKITLATYEIKNLEKTRAKKREECYMKRSFTDKQIVDLKEELYREEIGQKTIRTILESLRNKLSLTQAQLQQQEANSCRHKLKTCNK